MRRIVAIGGGEIKDLETLDIDKQIVKSVCKKNPNALFIPTASDDSMDYIDSFRRVYGSKLNCTVDVLLLIKEQPKPNDIERKIRWADIIYVGGGVTNKMLAIWRKNSVDILLKKAYEEGTVMSGLSAGSICWFKEGLHLIDAIHCPHFNKEEEAKKFEKRVVNSKMIGIALEDKCAIEFNDKQYRIHKSDNSAKAYKLYVKNGKVVKEELTNRDYKEWIIRKG